MRPAPIASKRFTLIEMLVVVAIIATLAALLSPSLQKSLEAARGAACANCLRQCGMALATYSGDFRGWIPGGQVYGKEFGTGQDAGYPWSLLLTNVAPRLGAPTAGDYVGDPQLFSCPSGPVVAYRYTGDGNWWELYSGAPRQTYGMGQIHQNDRGARKPFAQSAKWHIWGHWAGYNSWVHLDAVDAPANVPLLADSTREDGGALVQNYNWGNNGDAGTNWGLIHARHNGRAGLWFADGHVAAKSDQEVGVNYGVKTVRTPGGTPFDWH